MPSVPLLFVALTVVARAETDVLVIGAGISGLTAATVIKESDRSIAVVEAQDVIGGRLLRTQVGRNGAKGWIDLGGQWIGATQTHLAKLADKLGIQSFPTPHHGSDVFIINGKRTVHNMSFPMPPYAEEQLSKEWTGFNFTSEERDDLVEVWRKVEEIAATIDPETPWTAPNATQLDGKTVASWTEQHAKTSAGRWMMDAMSNMGGSGGFEMRQASMLHFAWTQRVAPQSEVPEGRLFDGGAAQFPEKLAAALGNAVHVGQPVLIIEHNDTHVTAITRNSSYTARAAVVAMPPHLAGRIHYDPPMPPMRDALTTRVPMGNIIKVFAIYDKPWWRDLGLSGLAAGDMKTLDFVADSTNPRPGSPGILASFLTCKMSTRLQLTSEEHRKSLVLADLATLFGPQAYDLMEYHEGNWPINPYIGGAFTSYFTPGTWTEFGEALRKPVGRIYWAGTEASPRWPGYIDGGVRAGENAAELVLEVLNAEDANAA